MDNILEDEQQERIRSVCDEIYETIKSLIPNTAHAERIFYVVNFDRSKIAEIRDVAKEMSNATTNEVRTILLRYNIDEIKLIANEINNRAKKVIEQNEFYMMNKSRISDLNYQLEKHQNQFSKDKKTGTQRVMGYTDRVYRARLQGEINRIAESKDFLSGMIYLHADAICKDKIKSYERNSQNQQIEQEIIEQEIKKDIEEQIEYGQKIEQDNIVQDAEISTMQTINNESEEVVEEDIELIQESINQEGTEISIMDEEIDEVQNLEEILTDDIVNNQTHKYDRKVPEMLANDIKNKIDNMKNQTSAVTLKLNRAFEVLKQQGIELSEQEKQMEIDYYNQKTQFVNEQEVFNMINIAFNNRIKYEKSKEQEEFLGMSM